MGELVVAIPTDAHPRNPSMDREIPHLISEGLLYVHDKFRPHCELPRGNGDFVLTIPGFMGDDSSLTDMNTELFSAGYLPVPSGIVGPNLLFRTNFQSPEVKTIGLHTLTGKRIRAVGQSAGGLYTKLIAIMHPEAVKQIICLGSPIHTISENRTNSSVQKQADMWRKIGKALPWLGSIDEFEEYFDQEVGSDIQQTYIYSDDDGVVPEESAYSHDARAMNVVADGSIDWQAVRAEHPGILNVKMHNKSHVGMAFDPDIRHVLRQVLAF